MHKKVSGYPVQMSKEGLLELKDPAKRDHPTLRWGQAVVIKFFGPYYYNSPGYRLGQDMFFADDELVEQMINQLILDYNL